MNDLAIDIQGVQYAYNGAPVLKDVTLALPRGEYLAVIGPNGGGKTTLLRLILGLATPTAGTVTVLGVTPREAAPRIGYVQQQVFAPTAFPVSVCDVVLMGRLGAPGTGSRFSAADHDKARAALDRVGMAAFAERRIGALSGGQRQRVFIARALAAEPDMLLLDEPTSSIDQEGKLTLFSLLRELHKTMTIVMVSHDVGVVSREVTSVACVNTTLYHHREPAITHDMAKNMFGCHDDICPVELIAHGLPHRVLAPHNGLSVTLADLRPADRGGDSAPKAAGQAPKAAGQAPKAAGQAPKTAEPTPKDGSDA
ncbi:MAG: metal ABC transporter ATP-binding protein [Desulfovibrionaceae bacterium]